VLAPQGVFRLGPEPCNSNSNSIGLRSLLHGASKYSRYKRSFECSHRLSYSLLLQPPLQEVEAFSVGVRTHGVKQCCWVPCPVSPALSVWHSTRGWTASFRGWSALGRYRFGLSNPVACRPALDLQHPYVGALPLFLSATGDDTVLAAPAAETAAKTQQQIWMHFCSRHPATLNMAAALSRLKIQREPSCGTVPEEYGVNLLLQLQLVSMMQLVYQVLENTA